MGKTGEPEGAVISYSEYAVSGRITDLCLVAADGVEFHSCVAFEMDQVSLSQSMRS